jgi:hypothetical protein
MQLVSTQSTLPPEASATAHVSAACDDLGAMYGTDIPRLRSDFLGYAEAAAYEADQAAAKDVRLRAFANKVHLYTDGRQALTFEAVRTFDRDCPPSFSGSS